jgi:hypothetical protein
LNDNKIDTIEYLRSTYRSMSYFYFFKNKENVTLHGTWLYGNGSISQYHEIELKEIIG